MGRYSSVRNDFEVCLQFLTFAEGGRQTPWIAQGYRSDFSYEDEPDVVFMIWPVFLDEYGEPFAEGTKLSTDKPMNARMAIVNDELRATEHRQRLKIGLRFFVREGGKIVAEGVVTRIVDLFND